MTEDDASKLLTEILREKTVPAGDSNPRPSDLSYLREVLSVMLDSVVFSPADAGKSVKCQILFMLFDLILWSPIFRQCTVH